MGVFAMVGVRVVLVLGLAVAALSAPTETLNLVNTETGENSLAQMETKATILSDLGVSEEEAFDCDWYTSPPGNEPDLPRAAVSLEVCKLYLQTRLVDCVDWTRQYNKRNPKVVRHITLEEVHSKCTHVKSALDQLEQLPGSTATCTWCMMHTNTN